MASSQQQQQQHEEDQSRSHSISLSDKQQQNSSIFSLTLDEFRTKSGKNFDSINMDEFLNSVWNEENQSCPIPNQNEPINDTNQSSHSLPIPLSGKTLEEVWYDIQRNEMEQNAPTPVINHDQTLGQMTLEDFLVKAGVIRESPQVPLPQRIPENYNFPVKTARLDLNTNVGVGQVMGFDLSVQPNCDASNVLVHHDPSMYQFFTQSGGLVSQTPPPPPAPPSNIDIEKYDNSLSDASEPSSKRRAKGTLSEAALERRNRRMIKNRESAARSRARKQAYTAELEIELNLLKEENTRLKLALATAERKLEHQEKGGKQSIQKKQRKAEKSKEVRNEPSLSC